MMEVMIRIVNLGKCRGEYEDDEEEGDEDNTTSAYERYGLI
jgi:hypothetical protein